MPKYKGPSYDDALAVVRELINYLSARDDTMTPNTYITFRILIGGVEWVTLANNAGTSVKMIQDHYNHVTNEMATEELTAFRDSPNALSEG